MLQAADPNIVKAVDQMRTAARLRDEAMDRVRLVRDGRFADVWPDQFSEAYPTAMVANFVDVSARDLAANLASLPTLSCAAGNMRSNADKRRAEDKNRIGQDFWNHSRLEWQMKYGADQYITNGFLPFWVEADHDSKKPFIHIEDPNGAYFEVDRHFRTVRYAKVWKEDINTLCALYPEYESVIKRPNPNPQQRPDETDLEVVRYIDDTDVILYLPGRGNFIIGQYAHRMSRCPVHIALRPGLHMDPRGMFDDVLYVQMAHAVMAALTLEAGHKAVQAPIAVPTDVQDINVGPDATISTDNPAGVRRVELNVPQAAFALDATLKEEMREGAGYPDTRLGNGPTGGSTGRGVQALEGGFDQQIALAQDVLKLALIEVTSLCFEMDATLWPNKSKTINGILSGESFQLTYTPAAAIGDNYSCYVTYGFASGTSPQGAIITLLQLRGDQLVSRDFVRRQIEMDLDVDAQQRQVDIETIEDGLRQGIAAALQSSGQMMAQGMTAEAMQFYTAAAGIIKGREQGKPLADLFIEFFQPPPPPPQAPGVPGAGPAGPDGTAGAPGAAGPAGGNPLDGVGPTGLPPGVAPGQAGLPPGGRPRVTDLAAGFTQGGAPNVGATVRARLAA